MRITRRWFRFLMIPAVILVLAVPLALFAYSHVHQAHAASTCNGYSGYSFCQTFDKYWAWNSSTKDASGYCCITVHYHLTGAIGYNRRPGGFYPDIDWYNQELLDPVLHAYIYLDPCAEGSNLCINDTVTKFEMRQYWNGGFDCSINPSISISVPWGFSVGGWYTCGNRNNLATYPGPQTDIVFTTKADNYVDNNSGAYVSLPEWVSLPKDPPCYGAKISSWFEEGNVADSFNSASVQQLCLPTTGTPPL